MVVDGETIVVLVLVLVLGVVAAIVARNLWRPAEHDAGRSRTAGSGRDRPARSVGAPAVAGEDPYAGLAPAHVLTPAPMLWDDELGREVTLRDWLRNTCYARPHVWNEVVAEFYSRAAADPHVAEFFGPTLARPDGMNHLQNHFLRALLLVTGSGVSVGVVRKLRERHATVRDHRGLPIDDATYDQVLGVLVEVLREHGVPESGIAQLASTVAPLRGALVVG